MNRKTLALLLLLAGICAACAVCITAGGKERPKSAVFCRDENSRIAIQIRPNWQSETIRPFYSEAEDLYYFFLPSAVCDRTIANSELKTDLVIDGENTEKIIWEEGKTYRLSLDGTQDIPVRFMLSSGLPALFFTTDTGSMALLELGKNNIDYGRVQVVEADGKVSYSGKMSVHGRGSSSWYGFAKKAFNFKLDKAAAILGMEKEKDFCLLANAWDYSYMNNKLAFDMAEKAGFRYVPDAEYADVYFDGDYRGIYLVTERIEVDQGRIDITDLEKRNREVNVQKDPAAAETFDTGTRWGVKLENIPADITGGYLIERNFRLDPDYPARSLPPSGFSTDSGSWFEIKSPEYADSREVDYIAALTNEVEEAVRSEDGTSKAGKSYLDYIDLTSFVRSYIIAEIACDTDKDTTNAYYVKDTDTKDPKIHMYPVWDYDNRFGGTEAAASPEVLTRLSENGWSHSLCEKTEFQEAVRTEWGAFFKTCLTGEVPGLLEEWKNQITDSVRMDLIRWPRGEGYPVKWPAGDGAFTDDYSFEDSVSCLKKWLQSRTDYLDTVWGE